MADKMAVDGSFFESDADLREFSPDAQPLMVPGVDTTFEQLTVGQIFCANSGSTDTYTKMSEKRALCMDDGEEVSIKPELKVTVLEVAEDA